MRVPRKDMLIFLGGERLCILSRNDEQVKHRDRREKQARREGSLRNHDDEFPSVSEHLARR